MKRKILVALLAIACAFCLAFGLTACFESNNGNQNNTEQSDTNTSDNDNKDDEQGDTNNPDPDEGEVDDPEDEDIPETEGLEFTLNDDEMSYSVTGIGSVIEPKIRIPAEYNGKPVTSIGNYAFYRCTNLESITIPNSVTSIGEEAFNNCTSLASITIPNRESINNLHSIYFI